MLRSTLRTGFRSFVITCLALAGWGAAQAGVLPEDRADLLYFNYDGGGVTISGPSMLVRKSIGENVSVQANYYIDMVSSASIDVETSASPYEDERRQGSFAVDLLHGKSTYTMGVVKSDESDYVASTMFANVSHDMFGDLTTIGFGYKKGANDVFRNVKIDGVKVRDPAFAAEMESQSFSLSLSQIITQIESRPDFAFTIWLSRSPYRKPLRWTVCTIEPFLSCLDVVATERIRIFRRPKTLRPRSFDSRAGFTASASFLLSEGSNSTTTNRSSTPGWSSGDLSLAK